MGQVEVQRLDYRLQSVLEEEMENSLDREFLRFPETTRHPQSIHMQEICHVDHNGE